MALGYFFQSAYYCSMQERAMCVVAGATRAFGRRTQGFGGLPAAEVELSSNQALKPPSD